MSTGHLLAVVSQHYQPVSSLVFSDDSLWLVSGGDDGRVIVWSLRRLIPLSHPSSEMTVLPSRILSESFDTSGVTLPHCGHVPMAVGPHPPAVHQLWSDHALSVTGICCGAGEGIQTRVATASLDQTCKVSTGISWYCVYCLFMVVMVSSSMRWPQGVSFARSCLASPLLLLPWIQRSSGSLWVGLLGGLHKSISFCR